MTCICSIHAHACSCMWMSMCVWVYKHTYDRVPVCRQPWVLAFHLVWSMVTCLWSLCTRDWLVLGRIGFSCLHVPSQGGCTGITSVWFTVQLYGGTRGSKLCSLALVWWQVLCCPSSSAPNRYLSNMLSIPCSKCLQLGVSHWGFFFSLSFKIFAYARF